MKDLPVEGKDFEFVETDDAEVNARSANPVVEILQGSIYEGVLVQYGKIQFLIEEIPPKVSFDFIVLESGAFTHEALSKDANFKNLLGDIILATIVQHEENRVNLNENRDNNTEGAAE